MAKPASLEPKEQISKGGIKRWLLNVPLHLSPTGQRQRLFFKTRDEARAHAKKLKTDEGTGRTIVEQQSIDAALVKLEPIGATLTQAVDFYVAHVERQTRSATISHAVTAWKAACVRRGLSERTHRDYQRTMQGIESYSSGDSKLANLSTEDLGQILDNTGTGKVSWQLQYRNLRAFWNWASKKGWCDKETFERIDKMPTPIKEAPETLTPDQCKDLLNAAEKHRPDCAAAVAVAIFGGVRMAELQRLQWSDVKNDYLAVPAIASKKRRRRTLKLTDPLAHWIREYAQDEGPICPAGWEQKWNAVRQLAGWRVKSSLLDSTPLKNAPTWPQNALRHTTASARLALGTPPCDLVVELGHSEQMLFSHYADAYSKKDAAELFRLAPKGKLLPQLQVA